MTSNGPPDSQSPHLEKPRSRNLTPSPRVSHFHGELTPVLSPLDAFALQGRLLAKQLDESKKGGRRMSRLPPASVARSLSQPRPGYYRAHSSGEPSDTPPVSPGGRSYGRSGEVEEPTFRPKSQHPMLSRIPGQNNLASDPDSDHERNTAAAAPDVPPIPTSAFGDAPRAESPEDASWFHSDGEGEEGLPPKPFPNSQDISSATRAREPAESSAAKRNISNNLAPPSSSAKRSAGSPGLPQHESSDDDYFTSSTVGSTYSKPRKLSSSSGMSMPQSPMTHFTRTHPRSPSPASENSPIPLHRPSFNFSRPLSRSSTTISMPSPSLSGHEQTDEYQSRTLNRGNRPSPITVPTLSGSSADDAQTSAPTTYIYAKYALPRGRSLSRNSLVFTGLQTPHFEWNEPLFENSPPPSATGRETFEQAPSSPSTTHTLPPTTQAPPKQELPLKPKTPTESERKSKSTASPKHESAPRKPAKLVKRPDRTPPPKRHSFDQGTRKTPALAKSNSSSRLSIAPKPEAQDDALTISTDSNATLRPHTSRSVGPTPATTLSAEDHVAKGIECHENGSLNESTYHLRIAAMQDEPTGMLLYALACRHGWGMRPNQREGVQWLRKAADSAVLEATSSEPRGRNIQEDKARQAQFALSIYELGVSHLNGWGIEQDKMLALRCFEIAGHWGDVDALAEAGFCYVEGLGCKKDLKKAAKYYRMAESKGMSMVGNSWIYKPKYMSDDDMVLPTPSLNSVAPGQDKKPLRTKSRTRSIFGRKKSTAANSVHDDS